MRSAFLRHWLLLSLALLVSLLVRCAPGAASLGGTIIARHTGLEYAIASLLARPARRCSAFWSCLAARPIHPANQPAAEEAIARAASDASTALQAFVLRS